MKQAQLDRLKKWFTHYVSGYYTGDTVYDEPVHLKEEHTARVCENLLFLCQRLDMPPADLILAETIGLFHDLGRFEQYKRYHTFNDMVSENHARLSVKEMARHKLLSECETSEKRLICKAVGYHNVPAVSTGTDLREDRFIRLIRDADKLDVWQVVIDYYRQRIEKPSTVIELDLPEEPFCSDEIIEAIFQERPALMKDVRTMNDVILLRVSWVFDLNFTSSFQMVCEKEYIEQLAGFLIPLETDRGAVSKAQAYVRDKLIP